MAVPALLVLLAFLPWPLASAPGLGSDQVAQTAVGFDPSPVPSPVSPLMVGEESPCGEGSWVAGTVEVCGGEIVYRDYVYDDFGASLLPGPPPASGFPFDPAAPPSSFAYGGMPPAGGQQIGRPDSELNTTDIVAVRVRSSEGGLEVSAELNTLFDASSTRVVALVDRDPAGSGGGGSVPGLVANPMLGVPVSAEGWSDFVELPCDASTNLCRAEVAVLSADVRLWVMAARAADGAVMNVAFRGPNERGFWWDAAQATALFEGDITQFSLDVKTADLDPGTTRRASTPAGMPLQRVYVSDYPLGEGVSSDGVAGPDHDPDRPALSSVDQAFTMLGRYQPYGFFLPPGEGPFGAQLALHGLSENHSARIANYGNPGQPNGFTQTFGLGRDRIIASPLGRGWRGWYSSSSERDAWDVLGDVIANYPVDEDELVISGLSMGGFGALWMGAMRPDVWASAINWVGWTGDFTNGNPLFDLLADEDARASFGSRAGARANAVELVGNLRNLPLASVYGALDALVHVTQALALRSALAESLVPSMFWLHPTGEHVSSVVADHWDKEAAWTAGLSRVGSPRTVTYRTDRRFFEPELHLVPDHAYWVHAIVPAEDGWADVEATSDGCGTGEPVYEVREGAGPIDPPPLLGSISQEVAETGRTSTDVANRLALTTSNVHSLFVDTGGGEAGACLGAGPVELTVETDGPLSLELSDGRTVEVASAGTHQLMIPAVTELAGLEAAAVEDAGDQGLEVAGAAVSAEEDRQRQALRTPGSRLPLTGGGAAAAVLLAATALLGLWLLRRAAIHS